MLAEAQPPAAVAPTASLQQLHFEIERLNSEYAHVLDSERYEEYPELFVEDCLYRVVPRENHLLGLPIAVIHCESKNMINRMTEIVLSGFYLDRIVRSGGRFLFKERLRIRLPATAYLPDRARIRRVTWAVRTTPHGVSTRPFIGDTVACLDRDR